MAQRSYHHGSLRSALLDAALTALERDGALPSLRSLAKACGVSQSAPYRHFASLDELRVALLIEGFRRLGEQLRAALATDDDPLTRLATASRRYIEFGLSHPALYALMFARRDAVTGTPEATRAGFAAYATLIEAVRACGVREAEKVAFVLWTGQHGLVDILLSGLRVPGAGSDRDRLIDAEIEMLLGHVRARAEAER